MTDADVVAFSVALGLSLLALQYGMLAAASWGKSVPRFEKSRQFATWLTMASTVALALGLS